MKQFMTRMIIGLSAVAILMALPVFASGKPKKLSKSVNVGDIVYFGKYEQDGNKKNGREKIAWKVLEKDEEKVLLMSEYVLDVKPFHKKSADITWECSTIRKWLNREFFKTAFPKKERKRIIRTLVVNNDNEKYETKGGNDTRDRVFLLSIDEAKAYFKDDEERIAEITGHGIKRIAEYTGMTEEDIKEDWFGEEEAMWYWLRSPGMNQNFAEHVMNDGWIVVDGDSVDNGSGGIRPAIWVKL